MNKLSLVHILLMLIGFLPLVVFAMQFVFVFLSLFTCAAMVVADKILA
tara:strand:- start:8762 stop:8905 length:144 start_codon:yes stop_codon:yes gene_type:complete